MKTILTLLALALPLSAKPFTLIWDKNPEPDIVSYLIEIKRNGESITQSLLVSELVEVVDNGKPSLQVPAPIELEPNDIVTVSAANGFFTSDPSDAFVIGDKPSKPGSLRIKHTVTIQESNDLGEWNTLADITTYDSASRQKFYRAGE